MMIKKYGYSFGTEGKLQPVALMSNLNPNLYNFCSTMNITSVGIESLDILNLLGIDSYLQDFVWTGEHKLLNCN